MIAHYLLLDSDNLISLCCLLLLVGVGFTGKLFLENRSFQGFIDD